jgi:hypothetical protein
MRKRNKKNQCNDLDDTSKNTIIDIHKETQNSIQENKVATSTDMQPTKPPQIFKRIIAFLREKDNQPLIANIVAIGVLVVTSILAWYTYRLYKNASDDSAIARKSANAATSSALIAQKTFEATKKYNDSSLAIQQKAFGVTEFYNKGSLTLQEKAIKSNDIDSKERFKRDTAALGLQIQSLKQNQQQFIKQNEPYLQVYIDSIQFINKKERIVYTMVNLTPIPVKIIAQKAMVWKTPIEPVSKESDLLVGADINYYVIKESPQTRVLTSSDTLTSQEIKWIIDGYHFTYWKAEFKFQNLISTKIKTYRFMVKLTKLKDKRTYTDFIYNENSEEK